jgi:hypothetical protein
MRAPVGTGVIPPRIPHTFDLRDRREDNRDDRPMESDALPPSGM